MINFIKSIFCKQNRVSEIQDGIVPGQIWALKMDGPWPSKRYKVRVLDVKDGWIRYYIGPAFDDERKKETDFKRLYVRDDQ